MHIKRLRQFELKVVSELISVYVMTLDFDNFGFAFGTLKSEK